jgi:hypothetical protein
MKLVKANLLTSVTGTYDQTKTTIQGRVTQKTISGSDYLGPPLTKFNDVFTDIGGVLFPSGPIAKNATNRVFVPFLVASGTFGIALYNHTPNTNTSVYVGQIRFNVPNLAATVHTIRALQVVDTGTTGWKIFMSTTGSVALNGGTLLINNVDLADFITSPPTFGFATGNNQKAVYKLIDNVSTYTTSVSVSVATPGKVTFTSHPFYVNDPVVFVYGTLPTGLALNTTYYVRNPSANDFELSATVGGASITTTGSPGTAQIGGVYYQTSIAGSVYESATNRLYVHNGIAATHQYHIYDTSASPTYSAVSGLVVDDVSDVIQDTAHPYQNNDPVFITNLTGGAGLTNNTNYFVRNATANTYQLSATSGGAAINITTPGTATVGRSFATTGSCFVRKTANLPALSGTLLLTDSEAYALPGHTINSGSPCAFFATTTQLYLGKLSELTAGATTWPSLTSSNVLGSTNQYTTPTPTYATWSNVLDAAIFVTNGSKFIIKQVVNNVILQDFGRLNNVYYEGFAAPATVANGLFTIGGIHVNDGALFFTGLTTGQRGFITIDFKSDASYDYSYLVTPVLDTPASIYEVLSSIESRQINETGGLIVYYRTSGFGSISGGWTLVPSLASMTSLATGSQVQFKVLFQQQSQSFSTPTQIQELFLGTTTLSEISDNWEYSDDNSDNTSPSRTAFRLKKAYVSSVPTLYYRAYDLSDALLINNNTVTNSANFEYSTDNGMSWSPLGTIPNTVGTLIRYTFTSPPGVAIRPGLRES